MKAIAKSKPPLLGNTPRSANQNPHYRGLSRNEEYELAGLIAVGNSDARNRLVQVNLPLVIKIASDFRGRGLDLDDLIGEGNLGLIRAAKDFDPRFGTRFSTYAAYWIRQSIHSALINTTCTIRLPAHMIGMLNKWRRAERILTRERGGIPSFEDVAAAIEVSETQRKLLTMALQALRVGPECDEVTTKARCASGSSWDCGQACVAALEGDDQWRMLLRRMQRLDVRERTILELRYGLKGEEPLTLKDIGVRLGITREWVRKIEIRALHKLRDDNDDWAIDPNTGRRLPVNRRGGLPYTRVPSQPSRQAGM